MATTAEIQDTAYNYAAAAQDEAESFASAALAVVQNINEQSASLETDLAYDRPSLTTFVPGDIAAAPPNSRSTSIIFGAAFPALSLASVETVDTTGEPDAFVKSAPSIDFSSIVAPSALTEFTQPAPVVSTPIKPVVDLDTDIPDLPQLDVVTVEPVPTYSLPVFDDQDMTFDVIPEPTFSFAFTDEDYESVLLTELQSKLLTDLVNGGYGIETADEQGLWDRARERENRTLQAELEDIARQAASSGFHVPTGSFLARIDAARQKSLEQNNALSREIMVKKADLFADHRKFTLQEVRQVENMLIGMYQAAMERALKVSIATVEMGVAVYNLRIAQVKTKFEAYKTYVDVYKTKVEAALAPLEAYKIMLDAAKTKSEVQRTQVEAYTAQVKAVATGIEAEKAKLEVFLAEIQAEKAKVDVFGAQVQAYSARAQAKEAELGVYRARIDGEVAKVKAYGEEVDAYKTRVDSYTSVIGARKARMDASIAANEAKLREFEGKVKAYVTEFEVKKEQAKTNMDLYKLDIDIWKTQADALTSNRKIVSDQTSDMNRMLVDEAKAKVDAAKMLGELMLKYLSTTLAFNQANLDGSRKAVEGFLGQVAGISAKIE